MPPSWQQVLPCTRSRATVRRFRLAANHGGRLWFYEAREVPGARSGADVFDLVGKVRYIGVNSGFDGTAELAAIRQREQVATLVRAVLTAPVRAGQVSEGESCVLAFHLVDGTAVTRGLHLGTGRLEPGVVVPRTSLRSRAGCSAGWNGTRVCHPRPAPSHRRSS
jgi:hypothetical protein